MNTYTYAMDTGYWNNFGAYPYRIQSEISKSLGYTASYLTVINAHALEVELPQLREVNEALEFPVAAVFMLLDLDAEPGTLNHADTIRNALNHLPEGCALEVAVHATKRTLDDRAAEDAHVLKALEPILKEATHRSIQVLLYPHINYLVERIEDCVRLCKQAQAPNLAAIFCGFHWYAVDGQAIESTLETVAPWLRAANLCGVRRGGSVGGFSILPLDDSELE